MMTDYTVWFRGNRSRTEMCIAAYSAAQARAIFAAYHNVAVSNYIASVLARRAARKG
jgi:hypothetical protein